MDKFVLSPLHVSINSPVGGKALYLYRLLQAGFPVPLSFFITLRANELFIKHNKLDVLINEYLRSVQDNRRNNLPPLRDEIRNRFKRSEIPPVLLSELQAVVSFFQQEKIKKLAVRSSAQGEDARHFSYAGLFESILNVDNTLPALIDAVKQVWLSAYNARVSDYTTINELPDDRFYMGVVIQEMIDPQISGVFFSIDPLGKNKNAALLEYVEGHAENLVQGETTPHRILIGRSARDIPAGFADAEKNHTRLQSIVQQCFAIADLLRTDVDVEWAISDEQCYILQARPITGFHTEDIIWTDENVGEVIPDIVTPFTWSILEPITNTGFQRFVNKIGVKDYPEAGLFGLYEGKVYLNQSAFLKLVHRFYFTESEETTEGKQYKLRSLIAAGRLGLYSLLLPKQIKRFRKSHRNNYKKLAFGISLNAKESLPIIRQILRWHENTMTLHISCTFTAELYYQFLSNLCRKWFPGRSTVNADALLSGLHAAESAESGRALWQISQEISKSEKLKKLFVRVDPAGLRKELKLSKEGKTILKTIDAFLEKYGHGALHEFELYYPRWREDDRYIFLSLKNYIINTQDFSAQQLQTEQKRLETKQAALQELGFIRKFILKFILRQTEVFSTQRENIKQDFIRLHSELKKYLLHIGNILAEKKVIGQKEDILFLKMEEIETLILQPEAKESMQSIVTVRKESRKRYSKMDHPKKLIQRGKNFFPPEIEDIEDDKTLTGIGCSAGIAEGTVHFIAQPESFQSFGKGEILVTKSTNPGWTPLFVLAGAVVTEIGGALSHGAIIAREYGIPMVTAIPDVTKKLKAGMRVRVNGYTGKITILETIE